MRDDRVLLMNRVFHAVLAVVVLPFFVGLTFFPQHTDANFAWPLKPTMSAFWFGSLYLTVVFAFGRAALAKKWHHMALVMWTTIPVLAALGVITLLHWEKFTRGTLVSYVWFVVYVVAPLPLALMAWANARRATRVPDAGDIEVPRAIRLSSFALSALFIVAGAGLLFWPAQMAEIWPWKITPLSSRAIGALLIAPAVAHVVALFETRWSAYRLVTQAAILWFAAVLVSTARAWAEFNTSRPLTWGFVAFIALEFVFTVTTYAKLERTRRGVAIAG